VELRAELCFVAVSSLLICASAALEKQQAAARQALLEKEKEARVKQELLEEVRLIWLTSLVSCFPACHAVA
jgi:hypothetical protein